MTDGTGNCMYHTEADGWGAAGSSVHLVWLMIWCALWVGTGVLHRSDSAEVDAAVMAELPSVQV